MRSPSTRRSRRHWIFALVVLLGATLAAIAGVQTGPPRSIPPYALSSPIVYRGEVALAIFLCIYLPAAAVALAFEGRTIGKISTSGIELPSDLVGPVSSQQEMAEELERLQQDLRDRDRRLYGYLKRVWDEFDRLRSISDAARR